eukprot:s1448_g11.t1
MNPVEVAKKKDDHDSTGPQKRGRKRKTDLEAAAATATTKDPGPWLQRPILVHCEDSYSVNCASMSWLLSHAEARYLWLPDPWHMVHNVGLNSVKEANFFASVILTSTAMDVSWGPWNSEKWFRTLGQGVSEWLSHTGSDDPIVQVLLPRIAEEQGWEEANATAEDVAHAVMHARFMTAKGTKSQITRWWVWHERFASWIGEDLFDNATEPSRKSGEWTLRLVPLLYIGLQLNFVTAGESRRILKPLGKGVVHGDSSIRADALTVLCVQKELRRWYAEHRKTLRSREQCFQFYLNLASGASVFRHVLDIGSLTDAQLSKIGVITNMEGNEAYASKTLANHPMVALQDALVKRIFQLKFAAQKHRLQGLVLFMFAYPWKLILLAHPDQEARS